MATRQSIISILFRTQGTDKAAADIDDVTKAGTRLANQSASNGRQFATQAQGLGGLVAVYAGAAANIFAIQQAFAALQRVAKFETLIEGNKRLAESIGSSGPRLVKTLKDITDGQLSAADAAEKLNLALSAGLSTSQVTQLTDIANRASKALGRDLNDAFERLVKGVAKLEPELLDELGIFTRIIPATKAYAESVGRSVSSLTNFEKRQAFANAVILEGQQKFAVINSNAESTQKSLSQLVASLTDLGLEMGQLIAGPAGALADFFTNNMGNSLAALSLVLLTVFGKLRTELEKFATSAVKAAQDRLAGLADKFNTNKKAADEFQKTAIKLSDTLKNKDLLGNFSNATAVKGFASALKKELAAIAAGDETITASAANARLKQISAMVEAEQIGKARAEASRARLTDPSGNDKKRFKELTESIARYDAKLAALADTTAAYEKVTKTASGTSKFFIGTLNNLSKAATFAGAAFNLLVGGIGKVIGFLSAAQFIGSLFGLDIIGSLTKFIGSIGESSRKAAESINNLANALTNVKRVDIQSEFKVLPSQLQVVQDEVAKLLVDFGKLVPRGGASNAFELNSLGERIQSMTIDAQAQFRVAQLDAYRKKLQESGLSADELAVKFAAIDIASFAIGKNLQFIELGMRNLADSAGLTSDIFSKIIVNGGVFTRNIEGSVAALQEIVLAVGGAEFKIGTLGTDGIVNIEEKAKPFLADISQAGVLIEKFREDFDRGALTAETAAQSIAAVKNALVGAEAQARALPADFAEAASYLQNTLDVSSDVKFIYEQQLATLVAQEAAIKAINSTFKEGAQLAANGPIAAFFSGEVTPLGFAKDAATQSIQSIQALISVNSSVSSELLEKAKRNEEINQRLIELQGEYDALVQQSSQSTDEALQNQIKARVASVTIEQNLLIEQQKALDLTSIDKQQIELTNAARDAAVGIAKELVVTLESINRANQQTITQLKYQVKLAEAQLRLQIRQNNLEIGQAINKLQSQIRQDAVNLLSLQNDLTEKGVELTITRRESELELLKVYQDQNDLLAEQQRKLLEARQNSDKAALDFTVAVASARVNLLDAFGSNIISKEESVAAQRELINLEARQQFQDIEQQKQLLALDKEQQDRVIANSREVLQIELDIIQQKKEQANLEYQNQLNLQLAEFDARAKDRAAQKEELQAQIGIAEQQFQITKITIDQQRAERDVQKAILDQRNEQLKAEAGIVRIYSDAVNEFLKAVLTQKVILENPKANANEIDFRVERLFGEMKPFTDTIQQNLNNVIKQLSTITNLQNNNFETQIATAQEILDATRTRIAVELAGIDNVATADAAATTARIEQAKLELASTLESLDAEQKHKLVEQANLAIQQQISDADYESRLQALGYTEDQVRLGEALKNALLDINNSGALEYLNKIADSFRSNLGSAFDSLIDQMTEGTLTVESLNQTLADFLQGLAKDILKATFDPILDKITQQLTSGLADLFGIKTPLGPEQAALVATQDNTTVTIGLTTSIQELNATIQKTSAGISTSVAGPGFTGGGFSIGDPDFDKGVRDLAKKYNVPPEYLYAVMRLESGENFDPGIRNGLGSGATGLIQITPKTAAGLGYTTDQIASMSRADQLVVIDKFFESVGLNDLPAPNIGDVYAAIFNPANLKADPDTVLYSKGQPGYDMNAAALDINKDGQILRGELDQAAQKFLDLINSTTTAANALDQLSTSATSAANTTGVTKPGKNVPGAEIPTTKGLKTVEKGATETSDALSKVGLDLSAIGTTALLTFGTVLAGTQSWGDAFISTILAVLAQVLAQIGSSSFGGGGGILGGLGSLLGLAGGGPIHRMAGGGQLRDRVPAMLEPGEFVVRKDSARRAGLTALAQLNGTGMLDPWTRAIIQNGGSVVGEGFQLRKPQTAMAAGGKTTGGGNTSTPNFQLNFVNQGTPQEQAEQPKLRVSPDGIVVDIVVRDLKNNGRIRKTMRGK